MRYDYQNFVREYKDGVVTIRIPRVFSISDFKDPKVIGSSNFVATDGKSGSSSFQFGSKLALTDDDMNFLDSKITQIGNLTLDKKTNQINLELTISNLNIDYHSHQ